VLKVGVVAQHGVHDINCQLCRSSHTLQMSAPVILQHRARLPGERTIWAIEA
jgi:hypothetical protein